MSHKAEKNLRSGPLQKKFADSSSAIGIHYQFIRVGFEDKIPGFWKWIISRISSRSKILNSNTQSTLCRYVLNMPNIQLQHLLNFFFLHLEHSLFIFNYIYIPLQGNFIQTHCLNRGFANLYLQLQGCSLP